MTDKKIRNIAVSTLFILAVAVLGEGDFDDAAGSRTNRFLNKSLRNPFWPVGHVPEGWDAGASSAVSKKLMDESDWAAPAAKIRVSGTSRMGNQTVAIINGDIKEVGDLIFVEYNDRIYKWKLNGVKATGKVSLERVGVSSRGVGVQSGDQ
jgi:hypothetical protein